MPSRGWKRLATLIVGVAILALAAFEVGGRLRPGAAPKPTVATTTVGQGPVEETVTVGSGTVQAPVTDSIAFQVAGTVASVPVQVGSLVKAGQTLATLDSSQLEAQLVTAQGNLAKAQASLQSVEAGTPATQIAVDRANVAQAKTSLQAKVKLDRQTLSHAQQTLQVAQTEYQEALKSYQLEAPVTASLTALAQDQETLAEQKAQLQGDQQAVQQAQAQLDADQQTGQQAVDVAEAQLAADQAPPLQASIDEAKAAVTEAQSQVDLDQSEIAEMTVASPVAGTVVVDDVTPGVNVSVGEAAFQVQQSGNLQVLAPVNEIDIAKIRLGETAQTTLDALPGQTFDGKVVQVAPTGTSSSGVSTYNVLVSLPADPHLQSGMAASVVIFVAQDQNVLRVPTAAVRGSGARGLVLALVGGRPRPQRVGVGAGNAQWTEITSGLHLGEKIVAAWPQVSSAAGPRFRFGPGFGGGFGGPHGGGPGGGR